jgi:hypothetical protein
MYIRIRDMHNHNIYKYIYWSADRNHTYIHTYIKHMPCHMHNCSDNGAARPVHATRAPARQDSFENIRHRLLFPRRISFGSVFVHPHTYTFVFICVCGLACHAIRRDISRHATDKQLSSEVVPEIFVHTILVHVCVYMCV